MLHGLDLVRQGRLHGEVLSGEILILIGAGEISADTFELGVSLIPAIEGCTRRILAGADFDTGGELLKESVLGHGGAIADAATEFIEGALAILFGDDVGTAAGVVLGAARAAFEESGARDAPAGGDVARGFFARETELLDGTAQTLLLGEMEDLLEMEIVVDLLVDGRCGFLLGRFRERELLLGLTLMGWGWLGRLVLVLVLMLLMLLMLLLGLWLVLHHDNVFFVRNSKREKVRMTVFKIVWLFFFDSLQQQQKKKMKSVVKSQASERERKNEWRICVCVCAWM
jgi:hypothetical protein